MATGVAGIVAVLGPFIYEPLATVAILAAVLILWFSVVGLRLPRLA